MVYVIATAIGFVVLVLPQLIPLSEEGKGSNLIIGAFALLSAVINIHHYFVDGVIWKLGNPEVKKDLFSHLKTD